jgi:hypothetical protein
MTKPSKGWLFGNMGFARRLTATWWLLNLLVFLCLAGFAARALFH